MDTNSIIERLILGHYTVATAESCTGGMVASTIVDYSGASACFNEGYVTYSNEAKIKNLAVKAETLEKFGAVSYETATEMAKGVKKKANSDFGLSTTGIAGPTGGSPKKPVGLVFIACAFDDKCIVKELHLKGDRMQVREQATEEVFSLLDECLNGNQAIMS